MAKTITIHAPNRDYTGVSAGVPFAGGKGKVDADNRAALTYFERHGYGIGKKAAGEKKSEAPKESSQGSGVPDGPPPKVGTGSGRDAWAAYAESGGIDTEGLNRAEIIKAIESASESEGD